MKISGARNGLPLLWLHGFMGSLKDWEPLVNEHFSKYSNILIDLPGHGNSPLSDDLNYLDLLDSLVEQIFSAGFITFVPIGYSMGGRIALHLQHQFPANISGLIGLSTAPGLKTTQAQQQRQLADTELMNELDQTGFSAFLKKWYNLPLFQSIQQNETLIRSLVTTRSLNNPQQLRKTLALLGNGALPSLWDKLPAMNLPALLLSGSKDSKYCHINEEMSELLPHGKHQIMESTDHSFHLEKPLETALAIKHFLRKSIEGV